MNDGFLNVALERMLTNASQAFSATIFFICMSILIYLAGYWIFKRNSSDFNPENSERDLMVGIIVFPFFLASIIFKLMLLGAPLILCVKSIWTLYLAETAALPWQNALFLIFGTLGFLRLVNFHFWPFVVTAKKNNICHTESENTGSDC